MSEDELGALIDQIVRSKIMRSERDIENYCLIKNMGDTHKKLLSRTREAIHKYYDQGHLSGAEKKIIKSTWNIINQKQPTAKKESLADSKEWEPSYTPNRQKDSLGIESYKSMPPLKRLFTIVQSYTNKELSKKKALSLLKQFAYNELDIKIALNIIKNDPIDKLISSIELERLDKLPYIQKLASLAYHLKSGSIDYQKLKFIFKKESIDIEEFDDLFKRLYAQSYLDPIQSHIDYKEIITQALRDFSDKEDIYFRYKIPKHKLSNFIKAVNFDLKGIPILLIDLTMSGNAKNALVITDKGIYYGYKELFGDLKKIYTDWSQFINADIRYDDEEIVLVIGENQYSIIDFPLDPQETVDLFKRLQTALRESMKSSKALAVSSMDAREYFPDIYQKPYDYLALFIAQTLLYASPIFRLYQRIKEIEQELDSEDLEPEETRALYELLSNKAENEKIIKEGERAYLSFITDTSNSIRADLSVIFRKENSVSLFIFDERMRQDILRQISSMRAPVIHKMSELHNNYLQLKHFWIQVDEGVGKGIEKFIKGGMLGIAGATLFGPLGVVAAVGATYLSESKTEEKIDQTEAILIENFNRVYQEFIEQLKIYKDAYIDLSKKIALIYIDNYRKAHKIASDLDKEREFLNYLSKELNFMAIDPSFVDMRENIKILEELGSE